MAFTPLDDRGEPCGVAGTLPKHPVLSVTKLSLTRDGADYLLLGVATVGGGLAWMLLIAPALDSALGFSFGAFGMIIGCAAGYFGWHHLIRRRIYARRWREFSRAYLMAGDCPSCGYALADLPSGDDGCVRCPECRAAWKGDRISDYGPGFWEPKTERE